MAVHKVKRSHSSTQQQPQHAKTARAGGPRPRHTNHSETSPQGKAHLFDVLHHLNRGYGIALRNLYVLEHKPKVFPPSCLRNLRSRTEELCASANHELLRIISGREERDALRLGRLMTRKEKTSGAKAQSI